jgi:dTDP-4-amino-4,6-dideoxygalactose transaminase
VLTQSSVIPFGRPWITDDDRQAVLEVLDGPILTHGPQSKAFEREFAAFLGGQAYCISVSSCTAALHLAYLHFGIGAGDEVIVPAQTHAATAHAVALVGATPVFVDCDPETGNVTAAGVQAAITPRTKAVCVVHFVGIPCHMPEIVTVATRHGLRVIEDCALAVGTRYAGTHVGLFGDVGGFSFYPVKHMTTGEGGMFVTRHAAIAEAVQRLYALGVDRSHGERTLPGFYDVPGLGLNYRMSEMQAALGRVQLRRVEEILARRQANFTALRRGLEGLVGIRILDDHTPAAQNSHYCLDVVLTGPFAAQRNAMVARLNAAGIGTSIYYPHPVPRLRYYQQTYGHPPAAFPQATALSDHGIALPVGPHITSEDTAYIIEGFRSALEECEG